MPDRFRGGASWSTEISGPDATITGAADVVVPFGDGPTHVHLGAESLLFGTVSLRAGYQSGYDARSFTAGAGIRRGIVGIDYAFMPTSYDLGATHAISSGDFHAALFSAIARADTMNLERLARGFPAECGAFVAYREVKDWWPNLQRKVGIEAGT